MSSAPKNSHRIHHALLVACLLSLSACGGGGGSNNAQTAGDSAWSPYVGTWSTGCQQRQGTSYSASTPGATQAITIQVTGATGSQATLTVTEKEWTTTDCSGATSFEVTTSGPAVLGGATKQYYNYNGGWFGGDLSTSISGGITTSVITPPSSYSASTSALLGSYTFDSWQLSAGSLRTSGPTLGVTGKFGFFVSSNTLYVLKGPSFDTNGYPNLVSRYSATRQ